MNDVGKENDATNNNKIKTSRSFDYKTKVGSTRTDNNILSTKLVVPLKYQSNF